MDISVLIPTYNGKKHLQESLPYLLRAMKTVSSSEIIVIDNHSTDDTEAYISHTYPDIVFEPLPDNYGFTKAVNHGAHKAKGRFLLILNNDCMLQPSTVHTMLTFLHHNPQYVATQPIVYSTKKSIENIGFTLDLVKARARPVTHRDFFAMQMYRDFVRATSKTEIFKKRYMYGLSATCLLIHRDIFMDIGLFDESFHSYLEDVDLCLRLVNHGYSYAPCIEAVCTHKHMATSRRMGIYKEYRDLSNWVRIIVKNYPRVFLIRYIVHLTFERMKNVNGLLKKMVQLNLKR